MNVLVLDKDFNKIYILDWYESLLWTDRYYEAGDFEIYTSLDYNLLNNLQEGYYLQIAESEHIMIIEGVEITNDIEGGRHMVITGRSLESILDRRIIWPEYEVKGKPKIYSVINTWLKNFITNPVSGYGTDSANRKIANFEYQDAYTDIKITSPSMTYAKYTGSNLYESIVTLCKDNEIGFKITLTDENKFKFQFYVAEDRSFDQTDNNAVIFSEYFDNISSTDYVHNMQPYKNTLVLTNSSTIKHFGTKKAGLDRRELYSSVSGTEDTDIDWKYEAKQVFMDNAPTHEITGEVDTMNTQFVYGIDYFLGDIVSIENEFVTGNARITEYTINITESGRNCYPTLEFVPFIDIDEG